MDEIINIAYKYLSGSASQEETARLSAWLDESEENKRYFTELSVNYSLHKTLASEDIDERRMSMYTRLNSRIDAEESFEKGKGHKWLVHYALGLVTAAVVILGVLFFAFERPLHSKEDMAAFVSLSNNTTSVQSSLLEDGTRVWMKPQTSIRYDVKSKDKRTILLNGEAYFEVMHDSLRPLTVKTTNIGVRVLGTAFSVKSSETDPRTEVVLEHGSIRLISPDGNNMVTLSPDQEAVFNPETDDVVITPVYAHAYVTQNYNLISLINSSIDGIVVCLEKKYGVKLSYTGSTGGKFYNMKFRNTDSLEDVISLVEYLTGVDLVVVPE